MAKDRIESKYVTVAPGVELHILEKGEGKPLVFIPGLTFSGEIFKNQLEYFSSEYRVIAIDPRGQGYSAKTVDGNDYLTHGRDVAGLIDALGLKDIVLIGWSTGNLDTWSYVQQFGKDKLRGVVTILLMQLQRQSIRIMKECHLLAGVIIHTNWLTFNSYLRQLPHRLLHTVYAECKVTQPTCFRAVHTLRRIFLGENFQLRMLIDTQIQLPVFTL